MRQLGEAPIQQPGSSQQAPAPGALNPDFYDEWSFYTYSVTLTANQELVDQSVSVDADSDFWWVSLVGSSTGTYELRFRLPSGRYQCSSRLDSTLLVGTAQLPAPVVPFVWIPANGRLGIDIADTSGSGNTVNLAFRGFRRFRRK